MLVDENDVDSEIDFGETFKKNKVIDRSKKCVVQGKKTEILVCNLNKLVYRVQLLL